MIDFINISRITNLMNEAFLIANIKLADLAPFLSSWTKLSNYYNTFN